MAEQLSQLKQAQGWTLISRTIMVRDQQPPPQPLPACLAGDAGSVPVSASRGRYRRVELVEGEIPLRQFLITPLPTK